MSKPDCASSRKWHRSLCWLAGPFFREIDALIFAIKTNALNRDMSAKIACRLCKQNFVHKDAPDA